MKHIITEKDQSQKSIDLPDQYVWHMENPNSIKVYRRGDDCNAAPFGQVVFLIQDYTYGAWAEASEDCTKTGFTTQYDALTWLIKQLLRMEL